MRTQATRDAVATIDLHLHMLIGSALLERDGDPLHRRARRGTGDDSTGFVDAACIDAACIDGACVRGEPEPECAADLRGACALAEEEERGVGLTGELGETHTDGAREDRRTVEHDEREGAGAEQEIGAPGGACGIGGTHDPERFEFGGGECAVWGATDGGGGPGRTALLRDDAGICGDRWGEVARVECARGVDPCDPTATTDGRGDERAGDGGLAGAGRGEEFGESPARDAATGEDGVECGEAGGEPGCGARGPGDDGGELLTENGEGHRIARIDTEQNGL